MLWLNNGELLKGVNMEFINEEEGTKATVTKTPEGYVTCFIDTDVEHGLVHIQIFKEEKEAKRKAFHWVHGAIAEHELHLSAYVG